MFYKDNKRLEALETFKLFHVRTQLEKAKDAANTEARFYERRLRTGAYQKH